jgi:hypothetical protein
VMQPDQRRVAGFHRMRGCPHFQGRALAGWRIR